MSVKSEKDKQKVTQEKYQAILCELLKQEDNKYCVDCDAKGPRWASWNLGVFLCIRCAGIHRNLGVHVSRVKSVNLDSWTAEQIAVVQEVGNSKGRAIYEANLPDNFRRPQTDSALEALIRAKYEHKKYMLRDWNTPQSKPPAASSVQELSKKEKKRSKSSLGDQLPAQDVHRTLGYVKNASDSNLVSSRATDKSDGQHGATPDRKAKDMTVQQPARSGATEQKKDCGLPSIELISLASPETDSKSDSVEFGSFLGAPVAVAATTTTATTAASTAAATASAPSAAAASSDLADLDFFSGVSQTGGGTSGAAAVGSGQATKDDILALYGPSNSSSMFGVPGGIYIPRQQQMMCQPGVQQPAGIGYPVMPGGVPMMQPVMGVAPVVPQMNGTLGQVPVTAPPAYGFFQSFPQAQMQSGPCQVAPSTGVMWCPPAGTQQPQQMVAGHTLSNVLWQ